MLGGKRAHMDPRRQVWQHPMMTCFGCLFPSAAALSAPSCQLADLMSWGLDKVREMRGGVAPDNDVSVDVGVD